MGDKLNEKYKKKEIIKIFENTIWFTYRKCFPNLLYTDLISDTGWGCMLRAG
jgi:hypothetical protein